MTPMDPDSSLGSYLRALRVARGGSLDDMARATRIGASRLRALEREEFSELPAPVFVKGFIHAYCTFLGESPDEALARYRRILGEAAAGGAVGSRSMPRPSPWGPSPILASLILLVVFGAGLLALTFGIRRAPQTVAVEPAVASVESSRSSPAPPPPAAPPPAVQMPVPDPARALTPPAPPAPPAVAPPPAQAETQRLLVKAVETTWLRVRMDDGRVVEELLQPGATREWTSARRFVLTVGNAGGLELELNGQALPRLGERGAVIRDLELPRPPRDAGS